jgi:hypothetical protein
MMFIPSRVLAAGGGVQSCQVWPRIYAELGDRAEAGCASGPGPHKRVLSVVVAHSKTSGLFFDGPGRREAAMAFVTR